MEKEQKKLLLVAVSVGVFLLVTITVALILLTSKTQPQEGSYFTGTPSQQAVNLQPTENNNAPLISLVQEPEDNTAASPDNTETTDQIAALTDVDNGDTLTIQIPVSVNITIPNNLEPASSNIVPVVQNPAAEPARTPATQPVSQQTPPERTTTPAPVTQPAAVTAPAPAAQPAVTAAPSRTINDYWIQTGAFTAKVRADDAKELLAAKGLASIIDIREIDGSIFYRVRLGPYTSETEANYWLALVQSIDGFGASQVRQTTRQL